MADAAALGAVVTRRAGSSPVSRTIKNILLNLMQARNSDAGSGRRNKFGKEKN